MKKEDSKPKIMLSFVLYKPAKVEISDGYSQYVRPINAGCGRSDQTASKPVYTPSHLNFRLPFASLETNAHPQLHLHPAPGLLRCWRRLDLVICRLGGWNRSRCHTTSRSIRNSARVRGIVVDNVCLLTYRTLLPLRRPGPLRF